MFMPYNLHYIFKVSFANSRASGSLRAACSMGNLQKWKSCQPPFTGVGGKSQLLRSLPSHLPFLAHSDTKFHAYFLIWLSTTVWFNIWTYTQNNTTISYQCLSYTNFKTCNITSVMDLFICWYCRKNESPSTWKLLFARGGFRS